MELALDGFLRIEFRKVVEKSTTRAEVNMDVDEPWQHCFSRGFDDVRFEGFRIGRVAFVNLGDLSAFDQDRSGFNNLSIPYENAGVLD